MFNPIGRVELVVQVVGLGERLGCLVAAAEDVPDRSGARERRPVLKAAATPGAVGDKSSRR